MPYTCRLAAFLVQVTAAYDAGCYEAILPSPGVDGPPRDGRDCRLDCRADCGHDCRQYRGLGLPRDRGHGHTHHRIHHHTGRNRRRNLGHRSPRHAAKSPHHRPLNHLLNPLRNRLTDSLARRGSRPRRNLRPHCPLRGRRELHDIKLTTAYPDSQLHASTFWSLAWDSWLRFSTSAIPPFPLALRLSFIFLSLCHFPFLSCLMALLTRT